MYNNYEEYMRSILGYPYIREDLYDNTYRNFQTENMNYNEIQNCYPEIYKIVNPMVKETCRIYSKETITKEIVDEITFKIYSNIEPEENRTNIETEQKMLKNGDVINPNAKKEVREDRGRKQNYLLKDLIKILVLNELIGNKNYPNRPPVIPPPRPQGPGGFYPPYGGICQIPPQMRQF